MEEGVAGERAFGVEDVDESLEGHVLVGVGAQVGFPDAGEELAEGRVTGEVGAQDEGVDEEADEVFHASSVRPAIGVPIGTSSPAPERDSSSASAAWRTMNTVIRRASPGPGRTAWWSSTEVNATLPRDARGWWVGGGRWGGSISSGTSARRSRQ